MWNNEGLEEGRGKGSWVRHFIGNEPDKGEDARKSTVNVETRTVHFIRIIHLQSENSRKKEGWKCLEARAWRVLNTQLFGGLGGPLRVFKQENDLAVLLPIFFFSPPLPFPLLFPSPPSFLVGGIMVATNHNTD